MSKKTSNPHPAGARPSPPPAPPLLPRKLASDETEKFKEAWTARHQTPQSASSFKNKAELSCRKLNPEDVDMLKIICQQVLNEQAKAIDELMLKEQIEGKQRGGTPPAGILATRP